MTSSVFAERNSVPDEAELATALGNAHARWTATLDALRERFDPLETRWSYGGKAHGWSLRCSHRGRPVAYLTPLGDGFRASLALPERAMAAALATDLPPHVRSVLAEAPTYPEGRAVRLAIASEEDVASLLRLVAIRMAS